MNNSCTMINLNRIRNCIVALVGAALDLQLDSQLVPKMVSAVGGLVVGRNVKYRERAYRALLELEDIGHVRRHGVNRSDTSFVPQTA